MTSLARVERGMHLPIVTVEDLTRAIAGRMGLPVEEAADRAEYVMDIFGFEGEIIDNVLEPEDRQLFYALERHGLVTAKSEENQLHHGQDWRSHYWMIRADAIHATARVASPARTEGPARLHEGSVYDSLPANLWSRR